MTQIDEEQLREEAAMWVVRMAGPRAAESKLALEEWLAQDPARRDAYNRLSRRFARSQILARSLAQARPGSRLSALWWGGAATGGLAAAAAMLISLSHLPGVFDPHIPGPAPSGMPRSTEWAERIEAPRNAIRNVGLPDGSHLTLDAGSVIQVSYGETQRRLRLFEGRARFDVAHEGRPFMVAAGAGTIVARGTVFDVAVSPDSAIRVLLLRGVVDVEWGGRAGRRASIRRLVPHQQAVFDETGFQPVPVDPSVRTADWPDGLLDADAMPLKDLLVQANHYAEAPVEAGDADIAMLKVSGRFRIDQPEDLVQHLQDLFGLTVDRADPHHLVLKKFRSEQPAS